MKETMRYIIFFMWGASLIPRLRLLFCLVPWGFFTRSPWSTRPDYLCRLCGTDPLRLCLEAFLGNWLYEISLNCLKNFPIAWNRTCAPLSGFAKRASWRWRRHIQLCASYTQLRPSIATQKSHGILTMFPSAAAFAIALGPTNPWLIDIAKETLVLRRAGV